MNAIAGPSLPAASQPMSTPSQPPQQQQQQLQQATANHPASIAAAATIALSATMLDPNEWNALASTSMVTLDDLRDAFLQQKKKQLKELEEAHHEELRELVFMSETFDKPDLSGSPWKLPVNGMAVPLDDQRESVTSFVLKYVLSLDNPNTIRNHSIDQPKQLRDMVVQELKAGPIELAPPPTPTAATNVAAVEAQRERDRQKENEYINKVSSNRSQAVARAAAAVHARAISEGVSQIKPLTIATAQDQGVQVAPLHPGQVPSFVILSLAPHDDTQSTSMDLDASNPMSLSVSENTVSGKSIKTEDQDNNMALSTTKSSLAKAVSPVPGLSRQANTHASGLRLPPSPLIAPSMPDTENVPPLHSTLKTLAPNPLSVTYAASLRPLPADPTRRLTGAGVGGGAVHHRGGRKSLGTSTHANGNSYSSAAAVKIGPAGSGQADLYRWYVRARASPGAGMVGKADKCLMTSDWKVAFHEQRFVRAMARIEKLKSQGEWSFRQPKKQKGPVVRKAHWDHLLEEMKWLQTDFREERRWKMSIAFQLAHEIAAWHKARTPAERASFCVSSRRSHQRVLSENVDPVATDASEQTEQIQDEEMLDASDAPKDHDEAIKAAVALDQQDDVDVPEESAAAVSQAVEDALDTADEAMPERSAEELDAEGEDEDGDADADADDVEAATAALISGEPSKPPAVEVVREPLAPAGHVPSLTAVDTDATTIDKEAQNPSSADAVAGLRKATKDAEATLASELPPQLLAALRAPIFSTKLSATIVSPMGLLESLDAEAAAALLGIEVADLASASDLLDPESLSFSKMFPELPLFGGVTLPDPTSKGDRRWDEGSLNQAPRLTHVTKILDSKPLLVSTLEPAKNRAHGKWMEDSDWAIAAEQSDPLQGVPDGVDPNTSVPGSVLFARKNNKSSKDVHQPVVGVPAEPSQPDARAALFMWTLEEDNYLLTLSKQYHNNWSLVADLFNSTRLNTTTDKREPWDCFDRYRRIQQAAEEGKPPPGPPQLTAGLLGSDTGDKKGDVKDGAEGASNSLAAKRDKLNKKLGSKYDGSKKKLRRVNLMEVMRKSAKRREASKQALQSQQTKKVNLNTHETHAQIKAGPAATPQSLSALKAERDQAALRQYYEQQRVQLAFQQQQQQQQRLLAQQAQAQRIAQPNSTATTGAVTGPTGQTSKPGQPGAPAPASQAGVQSTSLPQAQQKGATSQQPQQMQAQMQSQLQASQAAQMQNLYAQIQQQQAAQQRLSQGQGAAGSAGLAQVRPNVGPLNQQQLASLSPQQQQQYHAQLAAATAAAQQQQLRNQMAAVAAAQQGGQAAGAQGMPFSVPNAQAQFQMLQQQQNGQQQTPQQQQQQVAALQMYQQQQQRQAQQAQSQMRPPGNQGQQQQNQTQNGQQFGVSRPSTGLQGQQRPPSVPSTGNANKAQPRPSNPASASGSTPSSNSPAPSSANSNAGQVPPGMPATIQALQQQLAISLASSNLSAEQINGLAIQLYKQAQQQYGQQQQQQQQGRGAGAGARPPQFPANAGAAGGNNAVAQSHQQQILNQALQALAAQNQGQKASPSAQSPHPPNRNPSS